MGPVWQRVGCFTLMSMGVVCTSGAGAQVVPRERAVPPPTAEWSRGFTKIVSIRELDDQRMLVADRGENRLYVIDWDVGDLNEVLRPGEGPGEYSTIRGLHEVGENGTLLESDGFRWILLSDTTTLHTFTASAPLNSRFRGRLYGVASGGEILAAVSAENPLFIAADLWILELAPDLGPHEQLPRLDTIGYVRGAGRRQITCVLAVRQRACHFLEAEDQGILFPDGWIAVAIQEPYHVEWRSADGDWIRGEPIPEQRAPMSDREKCAAIGGWAEIDTECDGTAMERFLWPTTIPPFLTGSDLCQACDTLAVDESPWLFADPRGRLVIRRTPQLSRRENRYDIVDRAGRLVERVTLPLNEAIVGFGDSSVYTIRVDEVDLQWLRRHPWPE